MSRVAYFAPKKDFNKDVLLNQFIPKMLKGASLNHIGGSKNEIMSWQNNAPRIKDLLELSEIPDDVIVSFEYKVPNGGRIDCMLYGRGENGKENVIHIELKQWSNSSVRELFDNGVFRVDAFTGGSYRPVAHPSQQVAGYQKHLMNFVEELNRDNTHLEGLAYCYNYYSDGEPNSLYAEHYRTILRQYNLYSSDQICALASRIHRLLANGSGLSIFNRITTSRIRPSKSLLDAAANMFKGITEFSLLDDQIAASNAIFASVKVALKNSNDKTVIIVKGGPGTGKTVIALHVLAAMAQQNQGLNMFFTTRSKALRESLKVQLRSIKYGAKQENDASDLIANIFQFKPYHYKEGEVDLLLVDEAHRVQKSANYMADSFEEQTYLSQVHSLMYCSKVCVFFIDDHQAIKTSEVGNSEDIRFAAENYVNQVGNYQNTLFYKKFKRAKKQLEETVLQRERIAKELANGVRDDYGIMKKSDKMIQKLSHEMDKESCFHDVKSTIQGSVKVIQLELKSQFRCNGSDNYLDWLDEVLFNPSKDVITRFSDSEYDFRIFDSPQSLYDEIKKKNRMVDGVKQVARLVAGYCWPWDLYPGPDGDLVKNVVIGDFAMPWETNQQSARGPFRDLYASSADTWAIEDAGINQIGCIFSVQGFELDYIGVILGTDITYDSETDCLVGVPGNNKAVTNSDPIVFTKHILNAYRVLMSRGKKGCFIYSCNREVSDFIRKCL